ncbi:MAG: IS4 family transposase [Rhabdochlamydiaceae bacterium]
MISSIQYLAEAVKRDLFTALPRQRKTQRDKLALLVATMLHAKTANTMELAAELPLATERVDMRYQWVSRFLSNPHVNVAEVIEPFGRFILYNLVQKKQKIVLIIDQTQASHDLNVLMISIRWTERALPLLWCVKKTGGNIGFEEQKKLLDCIALWIPCGASIVLMGDRFYGAAELISYCKAKGWDYRLRLKGNLVVRQGTKEYKTKDLEKLKIPFLERVSITGHYQQTNLAVIHEEGHAEPWIIAMNQKPDFYTCLDYEMRWAIEPMFSDFKSRGFGLEDTQLRYPDRLERLILVMAIGMIWAVLIGMWEAFYHPLPYERSIVSKKL